MDIITCGTARSAARLQKYLERHGAVVIVTHEGRYWYLTVDTPHATVRLGRAS